MARVPTKGLAAGRGKAPTKPPPRRPTGTDKDRAERALDFAARRVPVWQVSVVTLLMRRRGSAIDGGPERNAIDRALAQTPPEVKRAAEMNMRGEWKPA